MPHHVPEAEENSTNQRQPEEDTKESAHAKA
jgi:hypothetical protein